MDNKIHFEQNSRESWEDQEKHSYDAKRLAEEYEERLYSEKGRRLLSVAKERNESKEQDSSAE